MQVSAICNSSISCAGVEQRTTLMRTSQKLPLKGFQDESTRYPCLEVLALTSEARQTSCKAVSSLNHKIYPTNHIPRSTTLQINHPHQLCTSTLRSDNVTVPPHTHFSPSLLPARRTLRHFFSKWFRDLPTLLLPGNGVPKFPPANRDHCISLFARRHDDT